ncbi:MAG: hypothetical protein ACRD8A_08130 [Candidatus Acidiferrales bacterium]
MRRKVLLCSAAVLVLFALTAARSHAESATAATFKTPYLVFGTQPVGQSSLTQTGVLTFSTGVGPVVVTIQSISIGGANAADFVEAGNGATPCNVGTTLNVSPTAPASCTIGATFDPTAVGTRAATITVTWSVSAGLNDGPGVVNLVGGDEIMYVTTGPGGQVLTVDAANQNVFQVLSNGPACNVTGCFQPTGAVVGPDGRIYITDQANSSIWRMNQDGSQLEAVYSGGPGCGTPPCNLEGPSFSAGGNGDVYFNTFNSGNGLFVISSVATTPFGGPFNAPAVVESCNPSVNDQNCPLGGVGTAFDASGNLLAADQENGDIWSLAAPYSSNTPPTAILSGSSTVVGIDTPTGIALNKANGQIYVANSDSSQQILQIVPPAAPATPYTTAAYYTFTSGSQCGTDFPDYFQFDMTGHLFVTTSASPQAGGANNCGKVWRIDPAQSPTATLLLDLSSVSGSGIAGVCGPGECGLNGAQAVGLAMPPTQGQAQTVGLSSSAGSATVGWPSGCTPTNTPGNNCSSTIGIQYPAGMFGAGDTLNVTFNETTQAQFAANAAGTPYGVTTLAPVEGYNGNGIVPSLLCTNGGSPCTDINTASTYNIFTTWQSNQTNYCTLVPHLLKGDPAGGPYTGADSLLLDTIIGCQDGGVGTKGQSSCSSGTSSSRCLSDWINTFGAVSGPAAKATITLPVNNASFTANQSAPTAFACSQNPTSPSIVTACPGVVTQPDGTIASVATGGNLPTSQTGAYSLSVTPNVSGASSVTSAQLNYAVVACHYVAFGFSPDPVVAGRFTIVTSTVKSCTGMAQKKVVVQFTLSGPFGRNCGATQSLMFSTPPFTLGANPATVMFPLLIPRGSCGGTYTVTAATYVAGTLVDTSSSSLIVTAH